MFWAEVIVNTVFVYLAIGFLFSIYFSFYAVKNFDESAKDSGIGFRLIIFCGVATFWAMFAWRMFKGVKTLIEKNAHRLEAEK